MSFVTQNYIFYGYQRLPNFQKGLNKKNQSLTKKKSETDQKFPETGQFFFGRPKKWEKYRTIGQPRDWPKPHGRDYKVFNFQSVWIDPCEDWPENYFENNNKPNDTLIKELYDYGRQNLALIHVMVQSPYITKIKRDVAYPFITFVADTGGLLGLCIGFSFISGIEILFWLCWCCRDFKK